MFLTYGGLFIFPTMSSTAFKIVFFFFCTGFLCHFEDLMLKGQYFIDPQRLSDQLAKVVSAQELRNIAADGMYSLHELCKITGKKR